LVSHRPGALPVLAACSCTTKRVGGSVQDFDAIKLLKFATN
jgi:hypothetical protein